MTHTPGPWKATPYDDASQPYEVSSETGYFFATIGGGLSDGEAAANARLVAAAPDLLAACERMVAVVREWANEGFVVIAEDDPDLVQALAAIAKARGTQNAEQGTAQP